MHYNIVRYNKAQAKQLISVYTCTHKNIKFTCYDKGTLLIDVVLTAYE